MRHRATATLFAGACLVSGCVPPALREDGLTRKENAQAEAIEWRLASSPGRIRDTALESYIDAQLRAIDATDAAAVAVYITDSRKLQIDLIANRLLHVRLGLLLALRNDDELIFVLAHELAHRRLQHLGTRRTPGWNAHRAERDADRVAVDALRRLARDEAAGLDLLLRMERLASDADSRRAIGDRIANLRSIVVDTPSASPPAASASSRLGGLLEPYRQRVR